MAIDPPGEVFARTVAQFLFLRDEIAALEQRRDEIRDRLMNAAAFHGVLNSKGSAVLALPDRLEVNGASYAAIERRRNVKPQYDEEAAERIAREKNLYDKIFPPIRRFDYMALYDLHAQGALSDEEMEEIISTKTTYSLITLKD